MIQPASDVYQFRLGRAAYRRIRNRGWLFLIGLVVGAVSALILGVFLWRTYPHTFTPYLKWQDGLVGLLGSIAFIALGACIFIIRFLCAQGSGYSQGMITVTGKTSIALRDLAPENYTSILWMMNSAFWCFFVMFVGLLPAIFIGWTLHLSNPILAFVATGIAIILSIAGFIVSVVAAVAIIVGCVGVSTFCRRLGAVHTYQLDGRATIRIENFVLTVTYPSTPETVVDLNLLDVVDQQQLLALLHKRWSDAREAWNPSLGEEIVVAMEEVQVRDQNMLLMAGGE